MHNISDPEELITADLEASGLVLSDIKGRPLGDSERAATGTPTRVSGYVIPYFDIQGNPLKFYRVKLINWNAKYRQVANEGNHIYFPPGFNKSLNNSRAILLVEGEKKAACAVKHGYAACAVSGVDSWRNRVITIPKSAELGTDKRENIVAKLPSGEEVNERIDSLATGFFDLLHLAQKLNKPIVIVFDCEKGGYQKREVQIAAAQLGYELRYRGLPIELIRHIVLKAPTNSPLDKVGIDDFFMCDEPLHGPDAFEEQLDKCLISTSAFPTHPNPREYVNKKLQSGKLGRRDLQALSTSLLTDLDAKGLRLRSPDDDMLYYFSRVNKELTRVSFRMDDAFPRSPFGMKLYKDYNLSINDSRILGWLATQYTGEQPIMDVRPKRVIALKGDQLYYQINSSEMVRVTADVIEVIDNGQHDILFESEGVEPIKGSDIKKGLSLADSRVRKGKVENIWYEVIKEARIKSSIDDRDRKIVSLLYSISPWFYRWRGTQLPAEMTVGEQGSGKSTLYILRLMAMQGMAPLKNSPHDLKDWGASVAHSGPLHVTDNVHAFNTTLRQELSDEICRVITEPSPAIEKRKLYSDFETVKVPVESVFAITALAQPFNNADIIARSIIIELDKGEDTVGFDVSWIDRQLERYGGRAGWMGNQLLFQQKMFQLIRNKWNKSYIAKYRLVNVEQLLILAAEVYGMDGSWIPEYLDNSNKVRTAAGDETLAGLKQFVEDNYTGKPFSAKDIVEWAKDEEDFKSRIILTNSRRLGNYIQKNSNKVATTTGIIFHSTYANATRYTIDQKKVAKMKEAEEAMKSTD